MENLPNEQELKKLKDELKEVKKELELAKQENPEIIPEADKSEEILAELLEKGVEVFKAWTQGTIESNKHETDKRYEFAEKQLQANTKVTNNQTWSRVIIIGLALIITAILALTQNLNEGFLAIVAVIIGAALKDSVLNLFKGSKKE